MTKMSSMAVRCGLAACFMLLACSDESTVTNVTIAEPAQKPIDGFQDILLGMSFEDAIGRLGHEYFNQSGLRECFDDLPIRGCSLSRSHERHYVMENGISYGLGLSFNKDDRLTDISLDYDREGDIDAKACEGVYARTIDWVGEMYGPLSRFEKMGASERVARSPKGTSYAIYSKADDPKHEYVSSFLETGTARPGTPKHPRIQRFRFVDVFSYYVGGTCSVTVNIGEPDKVARMTRRPVTASGGSTARSPTAPSVVPEADAPLDENGLDENGVAD